MLDSVAKGRGEDGDAPTNHLSNPVRRSLAKAGAPAEKPT
jgi:hypothetical protein